MLNRLSVRYQKEIALSFIAVFFISGLNQLKAEWLRGGVYLPDSRYTRYFSTGTEPAKSSATAFNFKCSAATPAPVKENNQSYNNEMISGSKADKSFNRIDLSKSRAGFEKPFIGGPSQPEMGAFKSVGADNMVSPFTGDFSYNIPLLDVGGYPVNMFYNSGISMDQEASWLGLGWNINPGTITRNMRGLPDDFNGKDTVVKHQSFRPDKTWGVNTGVDIRFSGFPFIGFGLNAGVNYNNKLGIEVKAGVHATLSIQSKSSDPKTTSLSFSAGLDAGARSGGSLSPSVNLNIQSQNGATGNFSGGAGVGFTYNSRQGLSAMHVSTNASYTGKAVTDDGEKVSSVLDKSSNSTLSFAYPSIMPSVTKRFTRRNYAINTSLGLEYFWVNPTFKLGGFYSESKIADEDTITYHPAYGLLNLDRANNNKNALLDFNRANDGIYTPSSPAIAMPVYTYDVFNIAGEGTGGSFRAYRSDIGHMRDATVKTREDAASLGLDLGFGNLVHAGVELSYVYSPTEAGDWKKGNATGNTFSFDASSGTYQAAYFKNPNEKTVPDATYQDKVANEDLVRLKLGNIHSPVPILLPNLVRYDKGKNYLGEKPISVNTRKFERDKRTQVISFLTAEESEVLGTEKKIYSIRSQGAFENKVVFNAGCIRNGVDSFYRNHDVNHSNVITTPVPPVFLGGEDIPFRHAHHISEVDVLGTDGRKYVYGLPVYNKRQEEVTFSINHGQGIDNTSKATYAPGDNTTKNIKGRDWILERQEMPAYTHSYLLTELLSPNYVDLTGNGLTEDDLGDGIKFNYSKFNDFKWRTPVGDKAASYSEGLKTDDKDDKAHYIYGERESWYLYSIESKNMVARFYVKNDRKDGRSVISEDGTLDAGNGMQRLEKVSLFSKGDLVKYGDAARPIKSIRFFQSYKLCSNVSNNNGECVDVNGNLLQAGCNSSANVNKNKGKLTLDSIWITYNGNTRKPKSRYVFFYPDTNNPDYQFDNSDRWGTYKPANENPVNGQNVPLSYSDYPYSVQDKVKADKYAAAWTMNKILLPSGGLIKIDYESDTYAYVQDRTATCMFKVLGFGNAPSLPAVSERNMLYSNAGENQYIYVQLPAAVTSGGKTAFAAKYLADIKQLYLKITPVMPMGPGIAGLAGTENVGVYADILDYNLIDPSTAWIKVAKLNNDHTPMVQGAIQFMVQNLPGKAFKGYDMSEESGSEAIVTSLAGMLSAVSEVFKGETGKMMADKKCQTVDLASSFIRLSEPSRNKYGGGLRVKRITIDDNWKKMTNQLNASYGQEYNYTTTELINGKMETISSGVASWEPSIGSDENPFREIMRYLDHNKGGPYDYGSVELPLGEMFYPSPMVGYSRVEVLSIHRDTVKNLPTRQVTEFYTNKEFPYKSMCTDLTGDANVKYEPSKILQLLKIDMKKYVTLSQGFLVETNDMNGKEKSHAVYSANDPVNPISLTRNFYNVKQATDKTYSFNHIFPTIGKADGLISDKLIGRDVELMTDFRQHTTESISANINYSFDLAIFGEFPIPISMVLTPVTREGTMYRAASMLKLVTHYGMLDSVVVIDKGSMISTKNKVYDAETGNPLLTRTQNEHNKQIFNFSYPAHWAYSGMGPAYKNIDASFKGLNFEHGILQNPPQNLLDSIIESGDEIYVLSTKPDDLTLSLPCDLDAASNTPWTTLKKNNATRIWAVNTAKVGAQTPGFLFMDQWGNPYNAIDVSIKIIRSGHRNLMDQSVGTITTLKDPEDKITHLLVFNESTGIIQTTAATYRDNWRVDNDFYIKDSTVTQTRWAPVHNEWFGTQNSYSVGMYRYYQCTNGGCGYFPKHFPQADYLFARKQSFGISSNNSRKKQKSWNLFNFNFTGLPYPLTSTSKIISAKLSLYAHTSPGNTTTNVQKYLGFNGETFHHEFSYQSFPSHPQPDPEYGHVSTNPHNYWWTSINDFKISRMIGQWSADNSPDWANYHFDGYEINSIENEVAVFGTQPINPSTKDYVMANGNDERIEFTNVFRGMVKDKLDPAKNYSPAIKLSIIDDNDYEHDARVCFDGNNHAGFSPRIDFKYYNCSEAHPYGYTPGPNEEVAACKDTIFHQLFCLSKFTDRKSVNPYMEGIFGNWRVDSTYAYYGLRKELNLNFNVDTRNGGTISDYKTFWNFATQSAGHLTRNPQAAGVWVWNSTITQYNRKGYEIENTDPLGRFNSGLYGYNQQLPIAVANNARVREIMFDGFEDFDYSTSAECITCRPHRYFNYSTPDNVPVTSLLDASQKHTGRYSMKVNAGATVSFQAPVTTLALANRGYSFRLKDTVSTITGSVLGNSNNGNGLEAKYYNHAMYNTPLEPGVNSSGLILTQQNQALKLVHPAGSVNGDYFSVKWSGKLQLPKTGSYRFTGFADNCFRLKINGQQITSQQVWTNGAYLNTETTQPMTFTLGQVVDIEVCYYDWWGGESFNLQWEATDGTYTIISRSDIPKSALYMPGTSTFNPVNNTTINCIRVDSSNIRGNGLTDSLALIEGKKMLLSAWVKVGTDNCCFPATYENSTSVYISFTGSSVTQTMKPAGPVIEGWQRYEAPFDVPSGATAIKVEMRNLTNPNNSTTKPVFFDDIRIHPYNANLKSFVYHSSNLRLMAELDENNYASYYEYDDDGTLTRVKKETVKGIKTITETRSAMQKKIVNDN